MPATTVRELTPAEFPLAEKVWTHYRNQKTDPENERIFGAFVDGVLAATARCTRHPDGLEMDCVFTLDAYKGQAAQPTRTGVCEARPGPVPHIEGEEPPARS